MAQIVEDSKAGHKIQSPEQPISQTEFNTYWRFLRSLCGKEIIRIEIKFPPRTITEKKV
jgi:hypothetical protein